MSLNCCSIRSIARRARFHALVHEHLPDIILGCESQIDQSYSSTEVFPAGYCVLRKDCYNGAGGVFICVKDTLSMSAVPSLDTSAELVWAKISLPNKNPVFICSFYRPPNNLLDPLIQLQESLKRLLDDSVSLPNVILAGDFNFPDIHWIDGYGQLQPNPAYGHEINSLFLDIINDFSLEQFVTFPTRDKNILDLIFSSQPIIPKLSVIPGMSDHEAILFSINSGANICHTKLEHKIFLYHKGNIVGIKDDLINFQNTFMLCDPYSQSVENNWNHFKSSLQASIIKHIPKKMSNLGMIYHG